MKLTVKQDNLAKALNAVSRIATAKAGLPILANVLIRTDENKLVIAATNLEIAIVASIGANIEHEGALAVPAKLFSDFVTNLPHTNIELESEETRLKINAGDFKSTINSVLADDFPALPDPATEKSFTVPADLLKSAISGTALATTNDVTRPILTGVYFYNNDGKLTMAATDGYRLAEYKLMDIDQDISAIIPASTLNDVTRLIGDNKEVEIKYNDEQVTFITNGISITSRLIDGKYINYKQLMPTDTLFTVKVDRAEFIKITKVAELFSRETAGSIIIDCDPVKQTLSARSIMSQLGENTSSVEAEITANGDDPKIGVNSKYWLDALNCLSGEKMTMCFNGKMAPVLMLGENDNYRHIVMPVRAA